MKTVYKGHEINIQRGENLGGWSMLYVSIFRLSDGFECTSFGTEDTTPTAKYVEYMKHRIDEELKSENPWSGT